MGDKVDKERAHKSSRRNDNYDFHMGVAKADKDGNLVKEYKNLDADRDD